MFILIESEFKSLIRTGFENIFSLFFKKKDNKIFDIILKLSIRVVSSLITVFLIKFFQINFKVRKYISYILIVIFIYFLREEFL